MKNYEIMSIYKVSLGEEGARKVSNQLKDIISDNGGKIMNSDFWGKRKFAFEVNNESEGFYEVSTFELDSSKVLKVKQKLNLLEGIVRYLITAQA